MRLAAVPLARRFNPYGYGYYYNSMPYLGNNAAIQIDQTGNWTSPLFAVSVPGILPSGRKRKGAERAKNAKRFICCRLTVR